MQFLFACAARRAAVCPVRFAAAVPDAGGLCCRIRDTASCLLVFVPTALPVPAKSCFRSEYDFRLRFYNHHRQILAFPEALKGVVCPLRRLRLLCAERL